MKHDCAWTGRVRRIGMLFAALALAAGTATAQGQDGDDNAPEETAEDDQVEEVIVTGTRLLGGDATARVEVITAEDIATQGLTTFEDIVRSIPQNFATINNTNNLELGSDILDQSPGALGLGTATANLRGFGSQNTLVLVNGKRLAGVSNTSEQTATNLNDIPAAAIDRVEVVLDGGSAVYGSDAVAGVINVITKREFTGVSVGAKVENSSTGAGGRSASIYAGTGWGSGNVSAIFTLNQSDPIDTARTGWTSKDYSDRYGGDQRYNFVGTGQARSGTVALSRWGPAVLVLPPGNDGRNAQPGDFVALGPSDYLDIIPKDIGGSSERRSVTASVLQNIGAREQLQLRTDLMWSETETASKVSTYSIGSIQVPASNAFNNFGHDVYVGYYADTEVDLGLLPSVEQTNTGKHLRYVLSATYEINDNLRVELDYSKAEGSSAGDQYMFAPPSSRVDDDARFQRLTGLIASSDPAEALNLFGDGTGQNPSIVEFHRSYQNDYEESHTRIVEPRLSGEFWELPGGRVGFVVGAELRKEWIEAPDDEYIVSLLGTDHPTRDLTAYFFETTVPVVGVANSRPFLKGLVFSLQARYDDYSLEGSVENDEDGTPILRKANFSNTVTRVAAAWTPMDTLVVRASRSEAFKTPNVSDVFGGTNVSLVSDFVNDPLRDPPWVRGLISFGPNPDLRPESSTNWTVGLDWKPRTVEGLQVKAAWSRIDLEDRIASNSQLGGLLPAEVYGNLPEFFVRDEKGNLIESIIRSVNIARRADERLDLEVSYALGTSFGTIRPRLIYHRVLDMFDQAVAGAEEFRFFGKSNGVNEYDLRANVSLISGPITADLWIRHTPSYINNDHESDSRRLPNETVASYTTTDLTATYEMDNGLLFRVGGRNIFDRDFPFMLSSSRKPYDSKRVDLRKRVLFFEMTYGVGGG